MKLFVLFMAVQNMPVTTQEFFNESGCNRAVHVLAEKAPHVRAWCLPKKL